MRPPIVVDTNVAVVANCNAEQADTACEIACVRELAEVRARRRLLLDDRGLILQEYRRHLSPSGQPGAGDAFFKWVYDNSGNLKHCVLVAITPTADARTFEEFPASEDLARFHRKDRKFVAVALSEGGMAPIVNATDTDWWAHRLALKRHGVAVRFLCPHLMRHRRS